LCYPSSVFQFCGSWSWWVPHFFIFDLKLLTFFLSLFQNYSQTVL
jgi:hypothetical protein